MSAVEYFKRRFQTQNRDEQIAATLATRKK